MHAVKFHLAHVYKKLGVTNRVQASMFLFSNGAGHNGGADHNGDAGHNGGAGLG